MLASQLSVNKKISYTNLKPKVRNWKSNRIEIYHELICTTYRVVVSIVGRQSIAYIIVIYVKYRAVDIL